jgi:hypothetical protein
MSRVSDRILGRENRTVAEGQTRRSPSCVRKRRLVGPVNFPPDGLAFSVNRERVIDYLNLPYRLHCLDTLRFNAVLENVVYEEAHHHVDFNTTTITQNTRRA